MSLMCPSKLSSLAGRKGK